MAPRSTRSANKRERAESTDQDSKTPSECKPKKKAARKSSITASNTAKNIERKITALQESQDDNKFSTLVRQDECIEEVVASLYDKRKKITCSRGVNPVAPTSVNLLHYMNELQTGRRAVLKLRQSVTEAVVERLSELQLFRTASPFDRRCTAVEWHPTRPGVVAVGSKGGEILVWDINTINKDIIIPGTGPAGSIQAMKYQPRDHSKLMTASIDGTVSVHNLLTSQKEVFMDTMNSHDNWLCSLDIHHQTNVATVGDNHGNITLKSLEGKTVFTGRLHRQKVTHVEYSRREEWLLATASTDQTVQLWDIRMLKGRESSLVVLKHDKPVNSVYFSLCSGTRLLTTDQHSQLRVYDSPTYDLACIIEHPHRHFRHITPHKASWHPLCDVIVVGRYPDEKFPGHSPGELRTIDMFDAETGKLVSQLHDPQNKGIISLNKFSHNGEYLASTMGVNVLLWSPRHDVDEKHRSLLADMGASGLLPSGSNNTSRRPRQPKQTKEKRAEQKTTQQKLKTKVTTKTKGKR